MSRGKDKNLASTANGNGVESGLAATQLVSIAQSPAGVGLSTAALESSVRLPAMLAPGTSVPDGAARKTRSAADLKLARESRANEALKMKDEQLKILSDQNSQVGLCSG
jgi:hypothetical protein